MPGTLTSVHITNILGVIGFLVLWFILFWCAHMLLTLLHSAPLLGSHLANDAGASTATQSGEVQGSIRPANDAARLLQRSQAGRAEHNQLIGWAIGPLGVTILFMREPSTLYILLDAIVPAIVSGGFLYLWLFTAFPSPIFIPHQPLIEVVVIAGGIFITSFGDFMSALRDLRYPLWGEARVLRSIQFLRASQAHIHFTRFGLSYLRDHFDSSPRDLLQAL